jgi:cellulose biosynthesis protein BcsQ
VATIAVYSIKGGVGKTATAVNLSYLSSAVGNRTVMWDLDPQSSATFYLRIQARIAGGGKKLLKKKADLDRYIRGTDFRGFDLLPGDFSYRKLDLVLSQKEDAFKRIQRILKSLNRDYDSVIIDCAPGLSIVSEALLHGVDLILIPTIPTPLSLRSLELIATFLDKQNLKRKKAWPFFCMVDRRKTLHRETVDNPPEEPLPFLKSVIPYSSQVEQMGLHRAPLPVFASSSAPSKAFRSLWREIQEKIS